MFELRRITLVDWYILDPIDIDISGHTGIFGANGSGKSSLIDALQVILTGVNRRSISLNASADDKHRSRGRSVRDYCLGMVSDRKEGGKPARDVAATRLTCVFERPETGEVHTIGVVLAAEETAAGSSEGDRENFAVISRFIATGVKLSQSDFVEWSGNQYIPLDWSAAKEAIERKADQFEEFSTSEKFVSSFLAVLRGDVRADPKAFLRNLKNAVAFRPIDSPTSFVRNYILEDKPVEVQRFRDSVRSYEEINAHIRELEQREVKLNEVENRLGSYLRTIDNAKISAWIGARSAHMTWHNNFLGKREQLSGIVQALEDATITKRQTESYLNGERDRLQSLMAEIRQHDAAQRADSKRTEIARAEFLIEKALDPIELARGCFHTAATAMKFKKHIADSDLSVALEKIAKQYEAGGANSVPIRDWCNQKINVSGLADGLVNLDAFMDEITNKRDDALAERAERKRDIQEGRAKLVKAQSGVAPLRKNVELLHAELKGAGIAADHLHTAVHVSDDRWQDVIEAILGGARETLLVRDEDLKAAADYLRENRQRFVGCRIYNNNRIKDFDGTPNVGTLAEFIETNDQRARAFLNQRLGGILAVESNKDLIKGPRAATADCMFNDGSTIQTLRPQQTNIIGKDAAAMVIQLERMVETLERGMPELDSRFKELEIRLSVFTAVQKFRDEVVPSLDGMLDGITNLAMTLEELKVDLETIEAELPRNLKEEIEQLKESIEGGQIEIDENNTQVDILNRDRGSAESKVDLAVERRLEYLHKLLKLRTETRFGLRLEAHKKIIDLRLKDGKTLIQINEDHEKRALEEGRKISGQWNNYVTTVRDYAGEHRRPQPAMPSEPPEAQDVIDALRCWLSEEKQKVVQHALREYQEQALEAQKEMETAFQEDFLARLSDRFKETRDILDRLNRRLKSTLFNEERYQFTTKINPEYEHIVRLANAAAKSPEIMTPLFKARDAQELGEHAPLFEAMKEVKKLLTHDNARVEDFEDYREYLDYEVNVCDPSGNIKTTLSSRQEIGSGGERQVPFYVAIAASLASMYHGRITEGDGAQGLALALFDEAFNKLDSANMHACMEFFDNLGLQVLLAAPDEKRMEFTDNLDTVIEIERDRSNNNILIDSIHPGPELKMALKGENPAYKPIDQFRESVPLDS